MQRRATSKKPAAEAEREINMDDKEATPVEDIEERLPPAEPNRPAQTEDVSLQEIMRVIMENNNNEIAYITVEINGVQTRIMIDTGANVSLIDGIQLNKIQEEGKTPILTLPISNIVLVGATGRQNKTVRRQVRLELSSNGKTIPMTFLVASGLPFQMLIGCDMLRQYSAVIDMNRAKLFLKANGIEWTADLTGSDSAPSNRTIYHIKECQDRRKHTK